MCKWAAVDFPDRPATASRSRRHTGMALPSDPSARARLADLRAALSAPGALPDAALEVRVGPLRLVVIREAEETVAQWETEGWCWPVEVVEA